MSIAAVGARPPPRRKSCRCCVRAKRRCDLQLPCSRCVEKELVCEYPSAATPRRRSAAVPQATFLNSRPSPLADAGPVTINGQDMFLNGESMPGPFFDYDLDLQIDLADPQYFDGSGVNSQPDLVTSDASGSASPALSCEKYTEKDYRDVYQVCVEAQHDAKVAVPSSSIAFEVKVIRDFHKSFAMTMKTPFLHPRLYEGDIPPCILDAFAASMLYMNRNESNEAAVFGVLDSNATNLLQQQHVVDTADLRGLLARVQALLIYQTIRIFDASIRHRAKAEAALETLQVWTTQLEQERDRLDAVAAESDPSPPLWDDWLLRECTRRAVLMSYFFISKYEFLKSGERPWTRAHHWTLSKPLWEASSSFEFLQAWKEKVHWDVSNVFVEDVVRNAKGADVDELGKIFIVAYMGIDTARRWFHDTGSSLD